jgi:hypothetical protein
MVLKPLPNWLQLVLLSPILVPMIPAIGAVFVLIKTWEGVSWLKRRAVGPSKEWHGWFAWRPVQLDYPFGPTVIFERVERRFLGHGYTNRQAVEYRSASLSENEKGESE